MKGNVHPNQAEDSDELGYHQYKSRNLKEHEYSTQMQEDQEPHYERHDYRNKPPFHQSLSQTESVFIYFLIYLFIYLCIY